MAAQNPNTLKGWFVTLAKPLQNQFWDWIDSFRHVNVKIVFNDLHDDLKALLNNIPIGGAGRPERKEVTGDTTIAMQAEYRLLNIAIKNTTSYALEFHLNRIGDAPGVPWLTMPVPALSRKDFLITNYQYNNTFWVDETMTLTEVSGNDFSGTPIIFLIDRR